MDIVIENNVPMTNTKRGRPRTNKLRTQLENLEVGQSFLIPKSKRAYIFSLMQDVGLKCATRSVDVLMIRVWRIA